MRLNAFHHILVLARLVPVDPLLHLALPVRMARVSRSTIELVRYLVAKRERATIISMTIH